MRWVGLCVGLGLWSCGGAQAPSPVVVTEASGVMPGGELAEVPPEVGKGLWLRVASPLRDLPILAQLLPVEENVELLLSNPERSMLILAGDRVADAVDLSRSLDVMAGSGPADRGKFVFAFAARPEARDQLSLKRVARGRHSIEEPAGRLFTACELWELPPPTGGRILCSGSRVALRELGPDLIFYSTRRTSSAFRVELAGRAYRGVLEHTLAEQNAKDASLPASERSGAALGRKWMATVLGGERLGFDVTLADRSIELSIDVGFRSVQSPLFASFLAAASSPRPLPAAYAALPADSQMRGAFSGLDAATGRALRDDLVKEMLVAVDEETQIPPAQRDEVERALLGVFPERLRGVFAVGQDLEAARKLLAVPDQRADASKELEQAMGGWTLIGVEAEPSAYLAAVQEFVKVANYRFPDKPAANQRRRSTLKQRPRPKGLPAGSLHLVDEVRPNPAYKPAGPDARPALRPYDRHIVVLPDATTVWFVAARKEADALARAKQLLVKPAAAIAPPDANGAVMLGELSLAGVVAQGLDVETPAQRDEARETLRRLSGLPAGGRTDIPLALRVVAEPAAGKQAYELRVVGRLSPEVVTDWFRFALSAKLPDAEKP